MDDIDKIEKLIPTADGATEAAIELLNLVSELGRIDLYELTFGNVEKFNHLMKLLDLLTETVLAAIGAANENISVYSEHWDCQRF